MLTENHVFNEIYEKYKNLVLKVAYMYSDDYSEAEDIMQEVFLRLYREMDEKPHTNVKAWLCITAKYLALNYRRKAAREVSKDEVKDENDTSLWLSRVSAEEEYFEKLSEEDRVKLHEHIFMQLMEKNPRWYEAIMLVCVRGCLQADAAKKLNMSESAFYVMLHRARNWIRKTYGVEYEELSRL